MPWLPPPQTNTPGPDAPKATWELKCGMRRRWLETVMLTRIVVGDVAAGAAKALPVDAGRLLEQPSKLEGMVAPFYGEEAFASLEALLVQGLEIMCALFAQLRDGNQPQVTRLSSQLNLNSNALAAAMSALNPHWGKAKMGALIQGHRALTIEQAKAVLAGDAQLAAERLDDVIDQVLYLAEAWGSGIGQHQKLPMCV